MSKKTFRDLIVYEIYPTSFFDGNNDGTGDLKGITSKLKYIKETGFNAIWLNPFYASPFRDGGYDVADFFDVDERFGTLRDFRNLCTSASKWLCEHIGQPFPFRCAFGFCSKTKLCLLQRMATFFLALI